ncbi:hypothetical protein, partial [Rhizocola hellebori]|uniref:hypothetical protein n=1 Tax=Rhizocola hellebori TaxID=1392758 RepID=UPI0019447C02
MTWLGLISLVVAFLAAVASVITAVYASRRTPAAMKTTAQIEDEHLRAHTSKAEEGANAPSGYELLSEQILTRWKGHFADAVTRQGAATAWNTVDVWDRLAVWGALADRLGTAEPGQLTLSVHDLARWRGTARALAGLEQRQVLA